MMAGYDQNQRHAAHLCWLCCRREVFTTDYTLGCITCR